MRGDRTVMQIQSLRDHPDMTYRTVINGSSYVSGLVLTVFIVFELNLSKQRMLFPKIFISVQEAKESDVRKFTAND